MPHRMWGDNAYSFVATPRFILQVHIGWLFFKNEFLKTIHDGFQQNSPFPPFYLHLIFTKIITTAVYDC